MRILVVDDHALVRDAIRRVASDVVPDATIVECASLEEAVSVAQDAAPFDVTLLDLHMPGMQGVDGVRVFCEAFPDTPVAVLSGYFTADDIAEALTLGAKGFIPKTMSLEKIFDAARMVAQGHYYIPPEILAIIRDRKPQAAEEHSGPGADLREYSLTSREEEVLRLLVEGLTNKAIALRLDLQEVTVKLHLRKIYRKIGVQNRAQAVRKVLLEE